MSLALTVLAGLFLPLFPLSMGFNALYGRIHNPLLRSLLLLLWPQAGLVLLSVASLEVSAWLVAWALFTSALYGFRALALRDLGLWTGFIATSAWSLLWILVKDGTAAQVLHLHALGFAAPLVLLALLGAGLERRFGAAYVGVHGGLAQTLPRFAGVLVVVVLAVVATPVFPGFFSMLATVLAAAPGTAVAVGAIWLLWSWAGARLLQGLVIGPSSGDVVSDFGPASTWAYVAVLSALAFCGVYLTRGLI